MVGISLNGCMERKNLSPMPSIEETTKMKLESRVNCGTARADIRLLEEERASVGKQILSGVRSVFPIAAAAGILMGDYSDRISVATGQYNADIDAKIAEIKRDCGVVIR
jgi:hypothetical protein